MAVGTVEVVKGFIGDPPSRFDSSPSSIRSAALGFELTTSRIWFSSITFAQRPRFHLGN